MAEARELPPALFLMGPTAAGKTDLAIDLCEQLPCDIVSVDSAMIYRGMDIGTAKPSLGELSRAPHRLIDICDPAETYSAADFRRDALGEMAEITGRGRIPLLVGGTMMYFKALLHGLADMPGADQALRAELEARAAEEGWSALHAELERRDPAAAAAIHPNNRQRVLRALEVVILSGKPISEAWAAQSPKVDPGDVDYPYLTRWQADAPGGLPYNVVQLAVAPDNRSVLHERIRLRFGKMLDQGFVEEVRALHARGDLHPGLPSVRCVGYRQAWSWLDGEMDYPTFVEKGVAATRQLAKRQLTWLRKWNDLHWINGDSASSLTRALKIIESRTTLIR
ncbi:tRNA (adenosine(37)-N6)-dimethylallyltransferase MiaA [Marinobacter nanhaiticus D15-8W]|uniref:tRNA dimethylallyltransferase n=1 Tax=Marinobacter nanhaiticus D15-8W TaxID=626887 RepID=N6WP43_9GAMM|nr:tRNA (adenosine(37)-N6)-dimethylallyltransferase MiaA [Marinobacter nanhaiticus]ENO13306.1 tRNA (adenosine(37)-N6)-dimethylallyltransferase MiaA [Marinobacter nanhaiticus D15-8W]BES70673.1 tRNA (adenosine(37)-N6)-dimethylallyltransferase MiaA [Marinobacter nanhaiticus D15-8W]